MTQKQTVCTAIWQDFKREAIHSRALSAATNNAIVNASLTNKSKYRSYSLYDTDWRLTRDRLAWRTRFTLDENAMNIGVVPVSVPVSDISMITQKDVQIVSTIRTPMSSAIRKANENITFALNLVFPDSDAINNVFRHIYAETLVSPILPIRSRLLTALSLPWNSETMNYYQNLFNVVSKSSGFGATADPTQDELNRLYYNAAPMYSVDSVEVSTIPSQIDAINVKLAVTLIDETSIAPDGGVKYVKSDRAAIEQLIWARNRYIWNKSKNKEMAELMKSFGSTLFEVDNHLDMAFSIDPMLAATGKKSDGPVIDNQTSNVYCLYNPRLGTFITLSNANIPTDTTSNVSYPVVELSIRNIFGDSAVIEPDPVLKIEKTLGISMLAKMIFPIYTGFMTSVEEFNNQAGYQSRYVTPDVYDKRKQQELDQLIRSGDTTSYSYDKLRTQKMKNHIQYVANNIHNINEQYLTTSIPLIISGKVNIASYFTLFTNAGYVSITEKNLDGVPGIDTIIPNSRMANAIIDTSTVIEYIKMVGHGGFDCLMLELYPYVKDNFTQDVKDKIANYDETSVDLKRYIIDRVANLLFHIKTVNINKQRSYANISELMVTTLYSKIYNDVSLLSKSINAMTLATIVNTIYDKNRSQGLLADSQKLLPSETNKNKKNSEILDQISFLGLSALPDEKLYVNPVREGDLSYHIEDSIPYIKYYRSVLREFSDPKIQLDPFNSISYQLNDSYPLFLKEYDGSPEKKAIRLAYKTLNNEMRNFVVLDAKASVPSDIPASKKITTSELLKLSTLLKQLPTTQTDLYKAFFNFAYETISQQFIAARDNLSGNTIGGPTDAEKRARFICNFIFTNNTYKPKANSKLHRWLFYGANRVTNYSADQTNTGSDRTTTALPQMSDLDFQKVRINKVIDYLATLCYSDSLDGITNYNNNKDRIKNEIISLLYTGVIDSTEFEITINISDSANCTRYFGSTVDYMLGYINNVLYDNPATKQTKIVKDPLIGLIATIKKEFLGTTDTSIMVGGSIQTKMKKWRSTISDNSDMNIKTINNVEADLQRLLDTISKIELLKSSGRLLRADSVNKYFQAMKSGNEGGIKEGQILTEGCPGQSSLISAFGIKAENDVISKDVMNFIINIFEIGNGIIARLNGQITRSPFKWAELMIQDKLESTTITEYRITKNYDNTHIYREGQGRPMVQNFGGGDVTIDIGLITKDFSLLTQIADASVEMEIPLRKAIMLDYKSPLTMGGGNSADYERFVRIIERNINEMTDSPTTQAAFDTPMIINNNITDMMGIRSCVVTSIAFSTVPEAPGCVHVSLSLMGTNASLKQFETPKYEIPSIDTSPIYNYLSSIGSINGDLAKSKMAQYASLLSSVNNSMLISLVALEIINVIASYSYLNVSSSIDVDNQNTSEGATTISKMVGKADKITISSTQTSDIVYNFQRIFAMALQSTLAFLMRVASAPVSKKIDYFNAFVSSSKESIKFLLGSNIASYISKADLAAEVLKNIRKQTEIDNSYIKTRFIQICNESNLLTGIRFLESVFQSAKSGAETSPSISNFKQSLSTFIGGVKFLSPGLTTVDKINEFAKNVNYTQLKQSTTAASDLLDIVDLLYSNSSALSSVFKTKDEFAKMISYKQFSTTVPTLFAAMRDTCVGLFDQLIELTKSDLTRNYETIASDADSGFIALAMAVPRNPFNGQVSACVGARPVGKVEYASFIESIVQISDKIGAEFKIDDKQKMLKISTQAMKMLSEMFTSPTLEILNVYNDLMLNKPKILGDMLDAISVNAILMDSQQYASATSEYTFETSYYKTKNSLNIYSDFLNKLRVFEPNMKEFIDNMMAAGTDPAAKLIAEGARIKDALSRTSSTLLRPKLLWQDDQVDVTRYMSDVLTYVQQQVQPLTTKADTIRRYNEFKKEHRISNQLTDVFVSPAVKPDKCVSKYEKDKLLKVIDAVHVLCKQSSIQVYDSKTIDIELATTNTKCFEHEDISTLYRLSFPGEVLRRAFLVSKIYNALQHQNVATVAESSISEFSKKVIKATSDIALKMTEVTKLNARDRKYAMLNLKMRNLASSYHKDIVTLNQVTDKHITDVINATKTILNYLESTYINNAAIVELVHNTYIDESAKTASNETLIKFTNVMENALNGGIPQNEYMPILAEELKLVANALDTTLKLDGQSDWSLNIPQINKYHNDAVTAIKEAYIHIANICAIGDAARNTNISRSDIKKLYDYIETFAGNFSLLYAELKQANLLDGSVTGLNLNSIMLNPDNKQSSIQKIREALNYIFSLMEYKVDQKIYDEIFSTNNTQSYIRRTWIDDISYMDKWFMYIRNGIEDLFGTIIEHQDFKQLPTDNDLGVKSASSLYRVLLAFAANKNNSVTPVMIYDNDNGKFMKSLKQSHIVDIINKQGLAKFITKDQYTNNPNVCVLCSTVIPRFGGIEEWDNPDDNATAWFWRCVILIAIIGIVYFGVAGLIGAAKAALTSTWGSVSLSVALHSVDIAMSLYTVTEVADAASKGDTAGAFTAITLNLVGGNLIKAAAKANRIGRLARKNAIQAAKDGATPMVVGTSSTGKIMTATPATPVIADDVLKETTITAIKKDAKDILMTGVKSGWKGAAAMGTFAAAASMDGGRNIVGLFTSGIRDALSQSVLLDPLIPDKFSGTAITKVITKSPFTYGILLSNFICTSLFESQLLPMIANGSTCVSSDIYGHIIMEMSGWREMLNKFFDRRSAYKDLPIPAFADKAILSTPYYQTCRETLIGKSKFGLLNDIIIEDREKVIFDNVRLFTDPTFYVYKASPLTQEVIDANTNAVKESQRELLDVSGDKLKSFRNVLQDVITKQELEISTFHHRVRSFALRVCTKSDGELDKENFTKVLKTFGIANSFMLNETIKKPQDGALDLSKQQDLARALNASESIVTAKSDDLDATIKIVTNSGLQHEFRELQNLLGEREKVNQSIVSLRKLNDITSSNKTDLATYNTFMALLKPYNGALSDKTFEIIQSKLDESIRNTVRRDTANMPSALYPAFKLYFIEKDAKEWLFFNDFFSYASVQSIDVFSSRKQATDIATIKVTNVYGNLTNMQADKYHNENPFLGSTTPNDQLTTMMIKPGCMIQIRLGYRALLNEEEIVFTGEITDISGEEVLTINAQGWGSQLTQTIGGGKGEYLGDLLYIIEHGNINMYDIIWSVLDMGESISHLGSKTLFGNQDEIAMYGIDGNNTPYGQLETLKERVKVGLLSGFLGPYKPTQSKLHFVNNMFRNINIDTQESSWFGTIFGKNRWMVYNSTVWDELSDMALQLSNTVVTTRPYDDEATLIMAEKDDYYQFTDVDFTGNAQLITAIKELRQMYHSSKVETCNQFIAKNISVLQSGLPINDDEYQSSKRVVVTYLTCFAEIRKLYGNFGANDNIYEIQKSLSKPNISELYLKHVEDSKSLANQIQTKGDYAATKTAIGVLLDNNSSEFKKTIESILETLTQIHASANSVKFTEKSTSEAVPSKYQAYFDGVYNKALTNEQVDKLDLELAVVSAMEVTNAQAAVLTVRHILLRCLAASPQHRKISEVHYKTTKTNIVKNNIMLKDGYNKVEMSFIGKSLISSFFNTMSGNLLNFGGLSVANINNPQAHTKLTVQASTMLKPSSIKVYSTFQKNAAAREYYTTEFKYIAANNILSNLMKDYYDGELIVIGDPYIKPHDIIYVDDTKKDMWGIVGVKEVHHMFSKETGFLTVITPDLETTMRMDPTADNNRAWWEMGLHCLDVLTRVAMARQFVKFGKGLINKAMTPKSVQDTATTLGKAVNSEAVKESTTLGRTVATEAKDQLKLPKFVKRSAEWFFNLGKRVYAGKGPAKDAIIEFNTFDDLVSSKNYKSALGRFALRASAFVLTTQLMKMFPTSFGTLGLKLGEFMNVQPINCMPLMSRGQLYLANLDGISREERTFSWSQTAMQYLGSGMGEMYRTMWAVPQTLDNIHTNTMNTLSAGMSQARISLYNSTFGEGNI